ncbi:unnamed protein product, partial [Rotaria magnacalcarata]
IDSSNTPTMVSNKLTQKSTQKQRQQDNDDDGYTSQTQRRSQIIATDEDTETRLQVRLDYRKFIDELNTNRQLYTSPDNDALERKIDQVDEAFAKGKNNSCELNRKEPFAFKF